MNNSIKEILDKFSNRKQGTLLQAIRELKEQDVKHACVTTEENINKLLNYITNLQKENEIQKKDNESLKKFYNDLANKYENLIEKYQDYKQRNEKAVEYIKKWGEQPDADMYMQIKEYSEYKFLLNILQGGDE